MDVVMYEAKLPEKGGKLSYGISNQARRQVFEVLQRMGVMEPVVYIGNPELQVSPRTGAASKAGYRKVRWDLPQTFVLKETAGDVMWAVASGEGLKDLPDCRRLLIEIRGFEDPQGLGVINFISALERLKEQGYDITLWTTERIDRPVPDWPHSLHGRLYHLCDEFISM